MTCVALTKVRAIDVRPYHWAQWCAIEDGVPFSNGIVSVRWREDGRLSFMLDTHNFFSAHPDEELELVALDMHGESPERLERIERQHAALVAARPSGINREDGET